MRRAWVWLAAAAMLLAAPLAGPAAAQAGWPQATSDVAPDPAITFRTLPNGLRYLIRPNKNPAGQVTIRMTVDAGSAVEREGQEGMAHLLEHVAFAGTRADPDGRSLKSLEAMGMRIGNGVNAFTSPLDTRFILDLPARPETLGAGFALLRGIASDLALTPAAITAERPIILAEMRQRDTVQQRLDTQLAQARLGDSPYSRRVIGRREVIETVTPEALRAFYQAYYRPERTVILVVGDIDPVAIDAQIRAAFSDWRGVGAAGPDPEKPRPTYRDRVEVFADPAAPTSGNLYLYWLDPEPRTFDRRWRVQRQRESIAERAFSQRLAEIIAAADTNRLMVGSPGMIRENAPQVARVFSYPGLGVRDPVRAMDLLIRAQRQVLEYGFTQAEIDRAVEELRTAQRQAVQRGLENRAHIEAIQTQLEEAQVPISVEQRMAIFEEAVRGMTAADAAEILKRRVAGEGPLIAYIGRTSPPGAAESLRAAYARAMAAPITAYAAAAVKPWPYESFGPPGKVTGRRDDGHGLGATLVTFENGARLTVKPTRFTPGEAQVVVRFGRGRLDLPRDRVGSADYGLRYLFSGGLQGLTNEEQRNALRGRSVGLAASHIDSAFVLTNGRAAMRAADLRLQLQVFAAYFAHADWRDDEWRRWVASDDQSDVTGATQPATVIAREARFVLSGADIRWRANDRSDRAAFKPAEARAFMAPIVASGPIDVTIVGDVTVEEAIEAVAATLGALKREPERPQPPPEAVKIAFPAKPSREPIVLTHKGAAESGALMVTWPTTDVFTAGRQAPATALLTDVLRTRAYDRFRREAGKTYSPTAVTNFSNIFEGYGTLTFSLQANPADLPGLLADVDALAAEFAAKPVTAEELSKAKNTALETLKRAEQTNAYWLNLLSVAHAEPKTLAVTADRQGQLAGVTLAEVQAAALAWLKPERAVRFLATPEPRASAAATTATPTP